MKTDQKKIVLHKWLCYNKEHEMGGNRWDEMKQIYVHGLGQTANSWERTLMQMNAAENSVCPDLAEISRGDSVTYENLYAAFSEICNKIDESVDLCGLSLGGILALNYAIERPEKVHSLALIAVQYKMPKKLLQFQNVIFRLMPESMFHPAGFKKRGLLQLCKTMMALDFSASVGKVSCPALIICGEKDSANKRSSIELAKAIKNAELQVIPRSGHELNVEAPEKLAELLLEFYNRNRDRC